MLIFYFVCLLLLFGTLGFAFYPLHHLNKQSKPKLAMFILMLSIAFVAFFFYLFFGDYQGMENYVDAKKNEAQVEKAWKQFGTVDNLIVKFKQALKTHPNDPNAWYLLGQLYLSQNKIELAWQAYQQAYMLAPEDKKIILTFAQTTLSNDHPLPKSVVAQLYRLLHKTPTDPDILNLLAINAYQEKNYSSAKKLWEAMLPSFAPDSPPEQTLLKAIANAQQRELAQ